jgi:hypothetical protein
LEPVVAVDQMGVAVVLVVSIEPELSHFSIIQFMKSPLEPEEPGLVIWGALAHLQFLLEIQQSHLWRDKMVVTLLVELDKMAAQMVDNMEIQLELMEVLELHRQ